MSPESLPTFLSKELLDAGCAEAKKSAGVWSATGKQHGLWELLNMKKILLRCRLLWARFVLWGCNIIPLPLFLCYSVLAIVRDKMGAAVLTLLSWPQILDFSLSDFLLTLKFWEASYLTEISLVKPGMSARSTPWCKASITLWRLLVLVVQWHSLLGSSSISAETKARTASPLHDGWSRAELCWLPL